MDLLKEISNLKCELNVKEESLKQITGQYNQLEDSIFSLATENFESAFVNYFLVIKKYYKTDWAEKIQTTLEWLYETMNDYDRWRLK